MLVACKEKGQGLIEYAMILALVSIVAIGALSLLGPRIANVFNTIGGSLGSV
jgi:pilus assembly protein Flp/PilA